MSDKPNCGFHGDGNHDECARCGYEAGYTQGRADERERSAKLVEALEYYAFTNSWDEENEFRNVIGKIEAVLDQGEAARKALTAYRNGEKDA